MKKRCTALFSAVAAVAAVVLFWCMLAETTVSECIMIDHLRTFKGSYLVVGVWWVALVTFVCQLGKWIWHADRANRHSLHVRLLGSIMLLLWATGWVLMTQAFILTQQDRQLLSAELLIRPAIAALNLFVLNIDSYVMNALSDYPKLRGAITLTSLLAFLCTIVLFLSLVSERLLAYLRLRWSSVSKHCPHVYVFFGLNEATELLAKDTRDHDPKSLRVVIEKSGDNHDDDKSSWNRVKAMMTHRRETFRRTRDAGALLSLSSVELSEIGIGKKDVLGEASIGLVKQRIGRLASMSGEDRRLHLFFLSDDEEQNMLSAAIVKGDVTISRASEQGVKVVIYCHARRNSVNQVLEESVPMKNVEIRLIDSARLSVELLKRQVENHPVRYVSINRDDNPGTVTSEFNSLVVGLDETGQDAVRFLYEFGAFMSSDSNNEQVKRSPFHCYIADNKMESREGQFASTAPEAVRATNEDGSRLLNFIHAGIGSTVFNETLHTIAGTLNYIVVTIGNNVENMTLAVNIMNCLLSEGNDLRQTRILVKTDGNKHVKHFRRIAEHYNQTIGCPCMEVFGNYEDIFSYQFVVEDQFKKDAKRFYNSYQKMINRQDPSQNNETWEQRHDRLLGNGYPTYENIKKLHRQTLQDMSNAWHKLTKRELMNGETTSILIQNLAITEHLRWCASHEMQGYKRGDKTDERLLRHNCLVKWQELDGVSQKACNEGYHPDYKKYDIAVVETTIELLKEEETMNNKL